MAILERDFYKCSALELSEKLMGKIFIHVINGRRLSGRITEVEAYMGNIDKAAHSYGGKRTNRTEIMYKEAGFLYVFFIYGMYSCANIVAADIDIPEAVLLRGIVPLEGLDIMTQNRFKKPYDKLTKAQKKNIANGPGKLCIAMDIHRSHNGEDLCKGEFSLEDDGFTAEIDRSKRIGIDYAEEAVDYLWRFTLK